MAKKQRKWHTADESGKGNPHHYFATSVAEWKVDTDLEALLNAMKKSAFPFNVYRVELPITHKYRIEYYTPEVPGDVLHWVGFWTLNEGEK